MKTINIKKMLQSRHREIFSNYQKIKIVQMTNVKSEYNNHYMQNYEVIYDGKNYICTEDVSGIHSGKYVYEIKEV